MTEAIGTTLSSPINIVLVNFSTMAVDLLQVAFAKQQDIRFAGHAATAFELHKLLSGRSVDVALIHSSVERQDSSALFFLELLRSKSVDTRPIILSEDMRCEDVVPFFYYGARGLICESRIDVSLLLKCIRCVGTGQVWANSEQIELLLRYLSSPRPLKVISLEGTPTKTGLGLFGS